jgi:hypothetical protein
MFTRPKSSTRWNQQTLIPAPILTRHRPVNNQSISDFDRLRFLRSRKFLQPIARQLFDRPAKARANFFQIAPAAIGNFRDRTFAICSRNNGEPLAPISRNGASLAASQTAGSLSPNEHNPPPKNYFFSALSVFSFFAIFCANPATNFAYDRCRG